MVGVEADNRSDTRQRLVALANMMLPGLYAWVTTVAYPATYRGTPLLARATALAALIALVAGPVIALERPRAGRAVGVLLFVALSVATWLKLEAFVSVQRIELLRAGLGAVGWALFAFGWGALRRSDSVPENDPRAIVGESLPARGALPRGAVAIMALGLASAMPTLYFAWTVVQPGHALLAQAAALACALALVHASATVAVERGHARPAMPQRRRLLVALRPLALVALLLGVGALWKLLS